MESKNNWKAWLYLAPVIILMAVFTFYPIIDTFFISFLDGYDYTTGAYSGFTFNNYIRLLTPYGGNSYYFNQFMKVGLPNTLLLTFITVPISIILSLMIAIGLNSIKVFKKAFQTIFFMPYVTNAIAIGMVFAVIFDTQYGIFNAIFGIQGFPWIYPNPAAEAGQGMVNYWSAFFAICFYIVWHSLPYKILIFLGGLQNIDQQYYDAAKIDGSNKLKTSLKITVPLLSPQILYIMITSFIGAFKEYNSVVGMFGTTGGQFNGNTGPESMQTVVFFIYERMKKPTQVQYACSAAVILFIIIMIFTAIQFKVSKKRVHY